jgi:hypothetical protein
MRCLVGLAAAAAIAGLPASLPAAAGEAAAGAIRLKLGPPERAARVKRVLAVDRNVTQRIIDKTVRVKEFELRSTRSPGEYERAALPPGTYDVVVELEGGVIEGVELKAALGPGGQLAVDDRAKIAEMVAQMKTWENEKRVLAMTGGGDSAMVLVELLRTEPTSYDREATEPFVVWRLELWRYVKLYGTWRREDDPKVLRRYMIGKSAFAGWTWNYESALGGITVAAGEAKTVEFVIPEAFSPEKGRVRGKVGKPADNELPRRGEG